MVHATQISLKRVKKTSGFSKEIQEWACHTENDGPTFVRKQVVHEISPSLSENWSFFEDKFTLSFFFDFDLMDNLITANVCPENLLFEQEGHNYVTKETVIFSNSFGQTWGQIFYSTCPPLEILWHSTTGRSEK